MKKEGSAISEQVVDRRRFIRVVRRHRMLIGIAAALGLLVGAAYSVHQPPMRTSTALVVLPAVVQSAASPTGAGGAAADTATPPYMATQIVIAGSDPVLSRVLADVTSATTLEALRNKIHITSPAVGILSISAQGRTAAQAEGTANAVADSYTAYVGSSSGLAVSARVLNSAKIATGTSPAKQLIVFALIGAVIGALIGIILAHAIGRRDRQLRTRDEMANSLALPVLASLPVGHPADAAGWTKLLNDYKPGATNAWLLRTALRELGVMADNINNGHEAAGSSLTVLSLSFDPGALALGPQLAVFAAQLGVRTALVIGPQDDVTATAALRTACAAPLPASSQRPSLLQVVLSDGSDRHRPSDTALTVVVVSVDDQASKFPGTMRTTATVLGVSAGAATAEQLARVAVTAAADGREIAGLLVADPEPTDNTAGRIPRHARRGPTRTADLPRRHNNGIKTVNDPDEAVMFTASIGKGAPNPTTEIRR
jgi:capsular polysaccharide biosynthesis protein